MEMTEPEEQRDAPVVTPLAPPPPLPTAQQSTEKTRPASVIVIAILFFLGALSELVGLFGAGHDTLSMFNRCDSAIFFAACLVMGIGLLALRDWARVGAIITLVVRMIVLIPLTYLQLSAMIRKGLLPPPMTPAIMTVSTAIAALFFIVYFGTMIFFLTRPGVKAAFGTAPSPPAAPPVA